MPALLGVEEEDEAQNDGEQATVDSALRAESSTRSRMQPTRRLCPFASWRFRIAPAFTSAGAETTRPFGWMKPSHSR